MCKIRLLPAEFGPALTESGSDSVGEMYSATRIQRRRVAMGEIPWTPRAWASWSSSARLVGRLVGCTIPAKTQLPEFGVHCRPLALLPQWSFTVGRVSPRSQRPTRDARNRQNKNSTLCRSIHVPERSPCKFCGAGRFLREWRPGVIAEAWPKPGQTWPRLGPLRSDSGHSRPNWARFGPKLVQVRPTSAKVGRARRLLDAPSLLPFR